MTESLDKANDRDDGKAWPAGFRRGEQGRGGKRVRLVVFSGFLGAGKTEAVLSAAAYLSGGRGAKLVIVENEIGEVSYDAALLNGALAEKGGGGVASYGHGADPPEHGEGGVDVRSMLSGCVCCTLGVDLAEELLRIESGIGPDFVVIEPTGLAFPDRILSSVSMGGIGIGDALVVTVVDAMRHERLMRVAPVLLESQIASAGLILLSKTDLAGAAQAERVKAGVRAMNQRAPIMPSPYRLGGAADGFWEEAFGAIGL